MTTIGFLSVAPVREGGMAEDVAAAIDALERFDVTYETTSMGTIVEAEDVGVLLDAVEAAHRAVDADRVSTVLKIDDKRTSEEPAKEKVKAVEEFLGRPARNKHPDN